MAIFQELKTDLKVSDALQLIKDLGGSASHEQITELAYQRFTPEMVKKYLARRLRQLVKWQDIDRHYGMRAGGSIYTIKQQHVKSAEEQAREEIEARQKIVCFRHRKPAINSTCPACHVRITVFDMAVKRTYVWKSLRFRRYFHERCADAMHS